ncbi:MAG: hypothetical protein ACLFU3_06355 [Dichotomicrobium sp.]
MTLAHLLFAIVTSVYILMAIQFEQRDLLDEHGADHAATGSACQCSCLD